MTSSSSSIEGANGASLWRRWPPLVYVASVAAMLVGWHAIASFFPPSLLPGPLPVFRRVAEIFVSGRFAVHMGATLLRVVAGFVSAFLVSIALGIAMGTNRVAERFFEPEIVVGLTIPSLAWSVIALMWFGISELAPIFTIFIILQPLITVNMVQGTKALDQEVIEMAKAFRADRAMMIRDVVVPQLVPYLLASTRFGLSLAWKVVVIAELLGLSNGIGYMIHYSFGILSMVDVFAWTIAFTLVMLAFEYLLLKPLEARITAWRRAVAL
jgi:NitT/TauT family transport system permease protein